MTHLDSAVPRYFGASIHRVEDPRFLLGQARFVGDLPVHDALHATFVRSPYAHARIREINVAGALAMPGVRGVFTGLDLQAHVAPIHATSNYPGFMETDFPVLALQKVRYVGEAVAMVIAVSRYLAEDAAELVDVTYEELPPVVDVEQAMSDTSPHLFDEYSSNIFITRELTAGDPDAAFRAAHLVVRNRFSTQRHTGIPMEPRGCLAEYQPARQELTMWASHQTPHLLRTGLSQCLGMPERRIRVICPDVGGGFGIKGNLYPDEVAVAYAATALGTSVFWQEDRREHFTASAHARDHVHYVEAAVTAEGIIAGLRATIIVDVGAYSVWPWTSTIEPRMASAILPGLYRIQNYEYKAHAVATNKTPLGPYRGVARTSAFFSLERTVDEIARRLEMDPAEIRRRNYIQSTEFPYTSATGMVYDSGSYSEALETALQALHYDEFRAQQQQAVKQGRYIGVGICAFTEQTGNGAAEYGKRGSSINMGYEPVSIRFDPSGTALLFAATHSHGQGHATTLAQIAADELGLRMEDISVVQGDTDLTPYGFGTFASRSAVMSGGATIQASRVVAGKIRRIAAHWLEAGPDDIELSGGRAAVRGAPERSVSIPEIAYAAIIQCDRLPPGEEPGLETTQRYTAGVGTGGFSNACHVVTVEVDPETGKVDILRYLVAEDCGRVINPMIVEGQVHGGIAQGIGSTMYEHLAYDEQGQLLTTSFLDYLVPGAMEVPHIEIDHLESPSPVLLGGMKGMGEGGAVAPAGAIANAVVDALAPLGVTITDLPLDPSRIRSLVNQARVGGMTETS
ncbi:MAG: xanthine dehydrogenase family protein molybdopterin-binding subunit [Chloroflexota bacterium]